MKMKSKWDVAVDKRERKIELQEQLTYINEEIGSSQPDSDKDTLHSARLAILYRDKKSIESELNTLDFAEEEYQIALNQREEIISEKDVESRQFLAGVRKATEQLDQELLSCQYQRDTLATIKDDTEKLLQEFKATDFQEEKARHLLQRFDTCLDQEGKKMFNTGSNGLSRTKILDEAFFWGFYQTLDELLISTDESIQRYIAQKLELSMRREEFINQFVE